MELSGDMDGKTTILLLFLYRIINRYKGLLFGYTWQEYQTYLSINLYQGLHGVCNKYLTKEYIMESCKRASAAFRIIYI